MVGPWRWIDSEGCGEPIEISSLNSGFGRGDAGAGTKMRPARLCVLGTRAGGWLAFASIIELSPLSPLSIGCLADAHHHTKEMRTLAACAREDAVARSTFIWLASTTTLE